MSDRTPEQVVRAAMGPHFDGSTYSGLAEAAVDALRVEGMLVEAGEVKVRLDGLEERLCQGIADDVRELVRREGGQALGVDRFIITAVEAVARVVRGETQEADRG